MRVIFTKILFEEKPLVWEYDPKLNKAVLQLDLDQSDLKTKSAILNMLENQFQSRELSFTNGLVEIVDVSEFTKSCSMMPYSQDRSFSPRSSSKDSPNFFSVAKTPSMEQFIAKRLGFKSVALEDLILADDETDALIFRNTLAVSANFQEVTDRKKEQISNYVRGREAFNLEVQLQKNDELYPIKDKLLRLVRAVYDEILNPTYVLWAEQYSIIFRRQLYFFLQSAVNSIMQTEPLNHKPTEFDDLTIESFQECFSGNRARQQLAAQKIRMARAEMSLVNIAYFFDTSLTDDLLITCSREDMNHLLFCYREILPVYNYIDPSQGNTYKEVSSLITSIVEKVQAGFAHDVELYEEWTIMTAGENNLTPRFKDFSSELRRSQLMQAEKIIDGRIKKTALSSFKKMILEQSKFIAPAKELLVAMTKDMASISEIAYRFSMMMQQLDSELCHSIKVQGYYSLNHTFATHLITKLGTKDIKQVQNTSMHSSNIAALVCAKLIQKLRESESPEISLVLVKMPYAGNTNLFLCEEWRNDLVKLFDSFDYSDLTKRNLKHERLDQILSSYADVFFNFIQAKSSMVLKKASQLSLSKPISIERSETTNANEFNFL